MSRSKWRNKLVPGGDPGRGIEAGPGWPELRVQSEEVLVGGVLEERVSEGQRMHSPVNQVKELRRQWEATEGF